MKTSTSRGDERETALPKRTVGRPRSAESRRAILDAAYAILIDAGLSGFTIEAVATRASVPRSTIYRWWPTRGMLAFESFRESFQAELAFAKTGNPSEDLRRLIHSLARTLSGPAGHLAATVIAEAQNDASVQKQFLEDFSDPLRRRSAELIRAGIETGQFRADLNIGRLLDAFVGATYLRLLFGLERDAAWADALADTLLKGCLD